MLKVGDWVQDGCNIYKFREPSYEWSLAQSLKTCTLWKPKVDEFIVYNWYGTVLFAKVISDAIGNLSVVMPNDDVFLVLSSDHKFLSDDCEPFIGTLPSFLNKY